MKKLLFAFLMLAALVGKGQVYPSPIIPKPNNSYGTESNRGVFDSTIYLPTGCGIPTDTTFLFSQGTNLTYPGYGQKRRMMAIYYDSCGHHEYIWDPSLQLWHVADSIGGPGTLYTADETTLHLSGSQFSIKSTYPGQSSIVQLGIVTSGIWASTPIADAYIASSANWNAKLGSTLNSAQIFVGNGSNVATPVSMSGAATMNNAGAISLTSTTTAGSCTNCNVTFNAAGQATTFANGTGGGSGAPFNDNTALVQNNADHTRTLTLSAAAISTGTNRTWTFPDANGTVVGLGLNNILTGNNALNGTTAIGAAVTFSTTNSISVGGSADVAAHMWSRAFNSDAGAVLSSTSGSPASLAIGSTNGITLLSTGQGQLNNYTTSTSFPGTLVALTGTDATGLLMQPTPSQVVSWLPSITMTATQGLSPAPTGLGVILGGINGGGFTTADTQYYNYQHVFWFNQLGKATLGGSDSVEIITPSGESEKIPQTIFGLTTNPLSQFASTTSAQLAGIISNETGTGLLVFNNGPQLVSPLLNTTSTTGYVWTATNTAGAGSWQAASGGASIPAGSASQVQVHSPSSSSLAVVTNFSADSASQQVQSTLFHGLQEVVVGDTVQGQTIGTWLSDNFLRSSLGSVYTSALPTFTLTMSSSASMNLTGTYSAYTNYIEYESPFGMNLYTRKTRVVCHSIGAATYGIGLGTFSKNSFYARGYDVQLEMYTGVAGPSVFVTDNGTTHTQQASSTTHTAMNVGDTTDVTIYRNDSSIIAYTYNHRTTTSDTLVYYYPAATLSGSTQLPNTGYFRQYFFGGNFDVIYDSVTSTEHKNGLLLDGNSILTGYNASSWNKGWDYDLFPFNRRIFDRSGGPGDRTAEALLRVPTNLLHTPKSIVLADFENDANNSVPAATTFKTNVDSLTRVYQANGITVYYLEACPQTANSVVPYNDTLYSLAAKYGVTVIHVFDTLTGGSGTVYASQFSSGDGGIHPNTAGHAAIAYRFKTQAPQLLAGANWRNDNMQAANIDSTTRFMYYNPTIGQMGAGPRVKDTGHYVQISPASPQTGNIAITGSLTTGTPINSSYPVSFSGAYTSFPPVAYQNTANQGYSGFAFYDNGGTARFTGGWGNPAMNADSNCVILREFGTVRNSPLYIDAGQQQTAVKHTAKFMYDSLVLLQPTRIAGQLTLNGITSAAPASFNVLVQGADSLVHQLPASSIATAPFFVQTANGSAYTNSTSSTALGGTGTGSGGGTTTIPSASLTAGKTIHIHGSFVYSTGAVNTTFSMAPLQLSGTVISLPASQTNAIAIYDMDITILTTGSSGTCVYTGTMTFPGQITNAAVLLESSTGTTPVTINTTSGMDFQTYGVWGTASTSNSIQSTAGFKITMQ
jgi:lysophospholipase L1-like esterase